MLYTFTGRGFKDTCGLSVSLEDGDSNRRRTRTTSVCLWTCHRHMAQQQQSVCSRASPLWLQSKHLLQPQRTSVFLAAAMEGSDSDVHAPVEPQSLETCSRPSSGQRCSNWSLGQFDSSVTDQPKREDTNNLQQKHHIMSSFTESGKNKPE